MKKFILKTGSILISLLLISCGTSSEATSGTSSVESSSKSNLANVSISITTTTQRIASGGNIALAGNIQNNRDTALNASTLVFYTSTNANINIISDVSIDILSIPNIAAKSNHDFTKNVRGHTTIGTMYYGACFFDISGDGANITLNAYYCSKGVAIEVVPVEVVPVDLAVVTLSATPTQIGIGDSINFSGRIQNQGGTDSISADLIFYRSSDVNIDFSDISIDRLSISSIVAGASSNFSKGVTGHTTIGTMYYRACVVNVRTEVVTNNNCSNGVAIEVVPVDLSISVLNVTPDLIFSGGDINFSGSIQNSGRVSSTRATLNIYRLSSANITPSDTPIESIDLPSIAASSSDNFSTNITGHSSGSMYYGACIANVRGEIETRNNCISGVAVEIISVALFVATFDANPRRIFSGGSINLSGYLQNDRAIDSTNATLGFYRSSDSAISTNDTSLYRDTAFNIAANATFDISRSVTGHNSGTAYYGVCVIAASGDTSCSDGVAVEVIPPDLVVATVDTNPMRILSGGNITLRGKVQNSGSNAPATNLIVYKSLDSVISTSDALLENISISSIAADSSIDFTRSFTGHNAGTFYYGACVIEVSEEVAINNNCSVGLAVEVIPVDLLVPTVDVNPLRILSGGNITLTANIRNDGETTSTKASIAFLRYRDNGVSTRDNLLGIFPISSITADASIDFTRSFTGHNSGTMYYTACVVDVSGEVVTNNNCPYRGPAVEVIPVDLLVATFDANPVGISSGGNITLTAFVQNDGEATSTNATLHFYSSLDNIITTSDLFLRDISISSITADASLDFSESITGHSSGTFYYGACLVNVSGELVTNNNCSSAVAVAVLPPDLLVATIDANPIRIVSGSSFTLTANVRNDGEIFSRSAGLKFYRSSDSIISTNDSSLRDIFIPRLEVDASRDFSRNVVGHPSGIMYYGACVLNVSGEVNTDNNCSEGLAVEVIPVDLVITAITTTNAEALTVGDTFNLTAAVQNNGEAPSGVAGIRWYRSSDSVIDVGDTELVRDTLHSAIAAGATRSISRNTVGEAGTFYYGACLFGVRGETNTTNNCSAGVAVSAFPINNVYNINDNKFGSHDPSNPEADGNRLHLTSTFIINTIKIGNATYIFTGSLFEGLGVFQLADDGSLTVLDGVRDDDTLNINGVYGMTTVKIGHSTYLFVAGQSDDGVSVFEVSSDGSLMNIHNIDDTGDLELDGVRELTTAQMGSNTYLFVVGQNDDGVSVFQVSSDASLVNIHNIDDTGDLKLDGAISATTAKIGNSTYFFVGGNIDDGVSVFEVLGNGSLVNVANVDNTGDLNFNNITAVTTAKIGSVTYLFVGSWNDGVSVFEVSSDGSLVNVDNIDNTGDLNLAGILSVTTAQIGSATYLFVPGNTDNGVSVFEVSADGSLTNVANILDTEDLFIDAPYFINVFQNGSNTNLFAGGAIGMSVFQIDNNAITGATGAIVSRAKNINAEADYPDYLAATESDYYRIYLPVGDFTFATTGDVDTVCTLYNNSIANLMNDTGETSLGINNNSRTENNCSLTYTITTAGYYYLKISGNTATDSGSYTITFP